MKEKEKEGRKKGEGRRKNKEGRREKGEGKRKLRTSTTGDLFVQIALCRAVNSFTNPSSFTKFRALILTRLVSNKTLHKIVVPLSEKVRFHEQKNSENW